MIKLPIERAYYPMSATESDLLYWIPRTDLEQLVKQGVSPDIIQHYPKGLEVAVDSPEEVKEDYGLDLSFYANISTSYTAAKVAGLLPEGGVVQAEALEQYAQGSWQGPLPEPKYSEGESVQAFFQRLAARNQ